MTTRQSRHMVRCWGVVLGCVTLLPACPEEGLADMRPRISVCQTDTAPEQDCNRSVDIGEHPLSLTEEVRFFIFNRGDTTLTINSITSSVPDALFVRAYPREVGVDAQGVLLLEVTPRVLGKGAGTVTIESNDLENSPLVLDVEWTGVPAPRPEIIVCPEEAAREDCGVDMVVRFDAVRREQQESQVVLVGNTGTDDLEITGVTWEGNPSVEGELLIGTSINAGVIPVFGMVPLLLIYAPADGVDEDLTLVIHSNDPDTPQARVHVLASSFDDRAPIAVATAVLNDTIGDQAVVGKEVWLDGAQSSDPQGDPIVFSWTLTVPEGSAATLDGTTAAAVHFVPDVAGEYVASLTVTDSLGQSSVPAVVTVMARQRFALRTILEWESGGDVDIHLLAPGGTLFGSGDCHFADPRPEWGNELSDDNPTLIHDTESAPGLEEIAVVEPAPGTYALYAHYFDAYDQGAAMVSARIIIDERSEVALQRNQNLAGSCALWHVADVQFPDRVVTPVGGAIAQQCR
ncbi:MAG: hypothetical protein AB2A00_02705 [Myxococcota bacterium]